MSDTKGIISILKDDAGELHFPMTSAEAVICDDKTLETVIEDLKDSIINVPLKEGQKGDKGVQGFVGPQGPKGDKGIRGLQGERGDTGVQGVKGVTGPKGDTGPQGAKGDTGAKGTKGDKGEKGIKGEKGDNGVYIGKPAEAPLSSNLIVDDEITEYDRLIADARRDYMGESHETLRDSANSNVEYAMKSAIGEFNYLTYEGQTIYATNTLEGHAKDAILNGCTLVNLKLSGGVLDVYVPDGSVWVGDVLPNGGYQRICTADTLANVYGRVEVQPQLFKVNTNYLISFDDLNTSYEYLGLAIKNQAMSEIVAPITKSRKIARGKFIITTESTLPSTDQRFFMILETGGNKSYVVGDKVAFQNLNITEYQGGIENWDIPYFTGMCNVQSPILSYIGKNLFDKQGHSDPSNFFVHSAYWSIPIQLKGNTTYTFSYTFNNVHNKQTVLRFATCEWMNVAHSTLPYAITDIFNMSITSDLMGQTRSKTFTSPANGLVYLHYYNSELTQDPSTFNLTSWYTHILKDIQLEESSTVTSYEDYKSSNLSLSEEVALRSLPNGVKDTYKVATKEYVQRIGEYTFDGSLPVYGSIDIKGEKYFYTCSNAITNNKKSLASNNQVYEKFLAKNPYEYANENCAWLFYNQNSSYFRIALKEYCNENREKDVTLWLKENPVTVQYELATPIVKTVELSQHEIYSYAGSTTYICSSGVEGLIPFLSIKVPTDVQAVIQTERLYKQELQDAQDVIIEYQLSLYEAQPVLLTSESEGEMPSFIKDLYELAYERGLRVREEDIIEGDFTVQ